MQGAFDTRFLALAAISVALVLVVSCTTETEQAPPTPNIEATVAAMVATLPTPMPTPNIEATVAAMVATQVASIPTPTPAPTSTPTPAPTAAPTATFTPTTTPTPVQRNMNLLHNPKETLDFVHTMMFRGTLYNEDSYWWATDLAITLRFRNGFGICLREIITSPSTRVLRPGDSTEYETRVHPFQSPDWPDWLVTPPYSYEEITITFRWVSPEEVAGLPPPRAPTPIPEDLNDCRAR